MRLDALNATYVRREFDVSFSFISLFTVWNKATKLLYCQQHSNSNHQTKRREH